MRKASPHRARLTNRPSLCFHALSPGALRLVSNTHPQACSCILAQQHSQDGTPASLFRWGVHGIGAQSPRSAMAPSATVGCHAPFFFSWYIVHSSYDRLAFAVWSVRVCEGLGEPLCGTNPTRPIFILHAQVLRQNIPTWATGAGKAYNDLIRF